MNIQKTEILFEQILKSVESINTKEKSPNDEESLEFNKGRFDNVDKGQHILNENLISLGDRFKKLEGTVSQWQPIHKTEHHHEHVFFPGIIAWINAINRWKVVLIITVLLVVSIVLNIYSYQAMATYKEGFLKYFLAKDYNMEVNKIEDYYEQNPEDLLSTADSLYQSKLHQERLNNEIEKLEKEREELQTK